MKKTYLMLLLALSGLGSGCTNDDGTTESPSGAAGEIQLVFSGSGESEEYTKAIASNSENEIKNLKVYLFASSSAEAGDDEYYYMETWSKTDATPTGNQFLLQSSGSSYKASIKPGELKGLPYLTLVCVANQDDLFKGDGSAFGALTAITVDANGAPQNAAAATDLADFKAAYTANLAADGIIKTPLAMTGMEKTKISGSVSKVAITLKRIVARFDIDNTTATSRLTITHIALGQGRPNASLFGAALAEVTPPAGVMTYADVEYKGEPALKIVLEEDVAEMEEVIVTGIFTRKAESYTGAAVTVTQDQLKRVGNQNIFQSLRNIDPSLAISDNLDFGSDPNKLPDMKLRGTSSFPGADDGLDLKGNYMNKPNQPLFILDGFEAMIRSGVWGSSKGRSTPTTLCPPV